MEGVGGKEARPLPDLSGSGADSGGPSGGEIGPATDVRARGGPIESHRFGVAGVSIEDPRAYQGGAPVGGPSSLFNIGGAPIAVFGGVFSGGLPIGGPVTQIFRSGAPVPNTLYIQTLESSGPIGTFFLGGAGAPIGEMGEVGAPIGRGPGENGAPIEG